MFTRFPQLFPPRFPSVIRIRHGTNTLNSLHGKFLHFYNSIPSIPCVSLTRTRGLVPLGIDLPEID